jgi:hypothetical protein
MEFKVYEKEDPGPHHNPVFIELLKKTRSYIMSHQLMHWNWQLGWGYPTKSVKVSDLKRAIIK